MWSGWAGGQSAGWALSTLCTCLWMWLSLSSDVNCCLLQGWFMVSKRRPSTSTFSASLQEFQAGLSSALRVHARLRKAGYSYLVASPWTMWLNRGLSPKPRLSWDQGWRDKTIRTSGEEKSRQGDTKGQAWPPLKEKNSLGQLCQVEFIWMKKSKIKMIGKSGSSQNQSRF